MSTSDPFLMHAHGLMAIDARYLQDTHARATLGIEPGHLKRDEQIHVYAPQPLAMHSIPIDPRRAAEQARGPKTYSETVRALQVVALTSSSADERRKAKKALDALEGASATTKETKMAQTKTRAYSSPFGEIPSKKNEKSAKEGGASARDLIKVLSKSANDPNDPKRDQAKELLRLLDSYFDDKDDAEASDDLTDEEKDAVSGHGKSGRAKALAGTSKVTRLSPYAAMLDEQMGLSTAGKGVRVEGTELILSPDQRGLR